MKILKYILLLFLLVFITATIFTATLKPDYEIVKSKIINASSSKSFNYINEYKNWQEISQTKQEDPSTKFSFSKRTFGKHSFCIWKGKNENGKLQTVSIKENKEIVQKMTIDGEKTDLVWTFKDTLGKTKIICKVNGKLSFKNKMLSKLSGGIENVLGDSYEKTLDNLNRNLDYEVNVFKIVVNGYLQKTGSYYLHKTITSKNEKVSKNIQILISNLIDYFKKNNLAMASKPFVIYNKTDDANQTTNFSVCISTRNQINIKPESGVASSQIMSFQAVKTTLVGDYSHIQASKDKTLNFISNNNLIEDTTGKYMEVYVISKNDENSPSKWITEIFVPAKSKTSYSSTKRIQDTTVSKPVEPVETNSEEVQNP